MTSWVRFSVLALLCLGGIFSVFGSSVPYQVEYFSTEAGLADRWVWDMARDQRGFLWFATDNGLNRYDGHEFITFDNRPGSPVQLSGQSIYRIYPDHRGYFILYYRFNRKFIDLFRPDALSLQRIDLNPDNGVAGKVLNMHTGPDGRLYVLAHHAAAMTVYQLTEDHRFRVVTQTRWPGAPEYGDLLVTRNAEIWISEDSGRLCRLGGKGQILQEWRVSDIVGRERASYITMVLTDQADGAVWFSSYGLPGLFVLRPDEREFRPAPGLPPQHTYERLWADEKGRLLAVDMDELSGRSEHLYCLLPDGQVIPYDFPLEWQRDINLIVANDFIEGDLWVATHRGIVRARPDAPLVQPLVVNPQPEKNSWFSVRSLAVVDETMLLATENRGWYRYDLSSGRLRSWLKEGVAPDPLTKLRHPSRFIVWGDSVLWGTNYIRNTRLQIVQYHLKKDRLRVYEHPSPSRVMDMLYSEKDSLFWLFTGQPGEEGRVFTFDPGSATFTEYRNTDGSAPLMQVIPQFALETGDGALWVGTDNGLIAIDRQRGTSRSLRQEAGFEHPFLMVLHEMKDGQLLVGSLGGGLHRFDPAEEKVNRVWTRQDGLPNNKIAGLLEDEAGNYWITTFGGLAYGDLGAGEFHNFFLSDGLGNDEYNRLAFYHDGSGRYYFGGIRGVDGFWPEELLPTRDSLEAPVLLSRVTYAPRRGGKMVEHLADLGTLEEVRLPAANRSCVFQVALADYQHPASHQFAYRLEGFDDQWRLLGRNRELRFSYLPAGRYLLRVAAADRNGTWSREERRIRIVVELFFFQTPAFILSAIALLMLLFYAFYRYQLRQRMTAAEAQRLRELDSLKTRLYANITHEFRTPLTLILGRSRQLKEKLKDGESQEAIQSVEYNGRRLLDLVNQLLELRKLEAGTLGLHWVGGDIIPGVRLLVNNFNSLARQKGVQLDFTAQPEVIAMDHDPDKLHKIISNLLANAVRFTPAGGRIGISVNRIGETLKITVSDNGPGISPGELERIFDRFFQSERQPASDLGAGIGLSLTKELVQLLGGRIEVESEEGKGALFNVWLPVHNDHPAAPESKPTAAPPPVVPAADPASGAGPDHQPLLLIVEDNVDLAQYLRHCLGDRYRLLTAYNGREGIQQALENVPDLILSDLMMPEVDGLTLVETLKGDQRTSHIPILVLTALAEVQDRVEGLRRGADAYLGKPFDAEELQWQVHNLLQLRALLRERYGNLKVADNRPHPDADAFDWPLEDAFLNRVLDVVRANLSDPDFSVEWLCKDVGVSSSQLHRKLTALTGLSAIKLIRRLRLEKARRQLLEAPQMQVAEIAYQAGFNDPRYFSRVFARAFDMTPTQYREQRS